MSLYTLYLYSSQSVSVYKYLVDDVRSVKTCVTSRRVVLEYKITFLVLCSIMF